ncbi:MAG TPA: glycosyltransferase family 39 protein [Actinophytocola sp.]|uniref:ArnT family glycosyltransferase n=1 Tax=Actinophytocola sp. TaxID=1872138 RepID=UPI002DDD118D|nr:glycosyltransferase family 39 protein [Actinophytocola sp.]HEV2782249.1 glycosyltransferase family 39 protein [Actinophytocola sp.]
MLVNEHTRAPATTPTARRPVIAISVALFGILLALSPWYGYYRDELYFRLLGEQPALGYFDTPPLTPMIARASITIFGDNVVALRIFPAMIASLVVVLVALICRELGGGRNAQVLAAVGAATSSMVLVAGHTLLTLSLDLALWTAATLFTLRALVRSDGRWWFAVGAVAGLATYNRHLILLLIIGVGTGILLAGPRTVLRDKRLWAAALLAVLIALPNLWYQLTNDWPQAQMVDALKEWNGPRNLALFAPLQILLLGPPLAIIAAAGLLRLWRDPRLRCFAIAYPVACALVLYSAGRADYLFGLHLLMFAAGCEPTVRWLSTSTRRRNLLVASVTLNAILTALPVLPLVPPPAAAGTPLFALNEVPRESIGWPQFVTQVATVVRNLPPDDRAKAVILAQNYGQAGILDRYAKDFGLPHIYSGHNELYFRGSPPESARVVVTITKEPARQATPFFTSCTEQGHIDNGIGLDNQEDGKLILVCRDPIRPWSEMWPEFRKHN